MVLVFSSFTSLQWNINLACTSLVSQHILSWRIDLTRPDAVETVGGDKKFSSLALAYAELQEKVCKILRCGLGATEVTRAENGFLIDSNNRAFMNFWVERPEVYYRPPGGKRTSTCRMGGC